MIIYYLTKKEKVTNYHLLLEKQSLLEKVYNVYYLIENIYELDGTYYGVEEARDAYDALPNELKELVPNYRRLITIEFEIGHISLFELVIELINNMGNDRDNIEEARYEYDNLSEEQKELVTNYSRLTTVEGYIEQADEVVLMIESIAWDDIYGYIGFQETKDAYDALPEEAKVFVYNYQWFLEYEEEVKYYAQAVIDTIDNIQNRDDVEEARYQYNGLFEYEKPYVSNYDLLTTIEEYVEIADEINSQIYFLSDGFDIVNDIYIGSDEGHSIEESIEMYYELMETYDTLSYDVKVFIDFEELESYELFMFVNRLIYLIDSMGTNKDKMNEARNTYDSLNDRVKVRITNYNLLVDAEFQLTQTNYTINYYFDNVLDSTKTVNGSGTIGNTITATDHISASFELDTTKTPSTSMVLTSGSNILNIFLKTKTTPSEPTYPTPTPEVIEKDNLIITDPEKVLQINKKEDIQKVISELISLLKNNTNTNETLVIQLNLNNMSLDSSILETIKGENVDLIIKIDDYTWTMKGKEISDISYSEIDLTVSKIEKEEVTDLAGQSSIIQLKLSHEGPFNFNSELKYFIGTEYKGQTVYLNYFNPETNLLEQVDSSFVDEHGYVRFDFSHASHYVVTKDVVADIVAPVIKVSKDKNNKVKITATDESGMKELLVSVNGSEFTPYVKKLVLKIGKNKIVIKAIDNANNVKTKEITYTVKKPTITKTKTITMTEGKTYQLDVKNEISTAKITYTTSNKKIATVSKTGKITASKKGKVTITTKVIQNGETFKLKTTITVK